MIIELQETISHQAMDITRLSDELYIQQKEISKLQKELLKLQIKINSQIDNDSNICDFQQDSPPPHY